MLEIGNSEYRNWVAAILTNLRILFKSRFVEVEADILFSTSSKAVINGVDGEISCWSNAGIKVLLVIGL